MATGRVLQRSFAGGEIAPDLYGRPDLSKYATGLATCENFIPLPFGPAANRPGFRFVKEVKDSSKAVRLIPFVFNQDQTYVIELGDQYARFHANGGTVLESGIDISGITQASPVKVTTASNHGYSVGDEAYIAGVDGMTEINNDYYRIRTVVSTTEIELEYLDGTPVDSTGWSAYSSGGKTYRVYEITTPFLEADLFDLQYVQSADVLTLVHHDYAPRELQRHGNTNWVLTTISFTPAIGAPSNLSASGTGAGDTHEYVVTALLENSLEESVASASASAQADFEGGDKVDLSWDAVSTASAYKVYKLRGGIYGYIGHADGTSFTDDFIEANASEAPPKANNPFSGSGDYPNTVSYFEQRRVFANTLNNPQTVWMTRSGTESNLTGSIPSQDDDSLRFAIAARQLNEIRHVVPLSNLVLLTSGSEWRVGGQGAGALTPSTISARPQSYVGAARVQPIVAGNIVLYVAEKANQVRDLSYEFASDSYTGQDVTILSQHLVENNTIVDWAYARVPDSLVWSVRDDGALLSLTYKPNQEVYGWARHTTANGVFESVAAVPEGLVDGVYTVVKRTINNRTVRYIERLDARKSDPIENAFYVDCGLTYNGNATTTVANLEHLEGEEVYILADGNVHPPQTVSNGQITLSNEAEVIQVGLPITSTLRTLPLVTGGEALGQGRPKRVTYVNLRVQSSRAVWAGPDADSLVEKPQRTDEDYGAAIQPITGTVRLNIASEWNDDGQVTVRQRDPLPIKILALIPEAAGG